MSKTSDGYQKPCNNKDNLSLFMEPAPHMGENQYQYGIQCHGCVRKCQFSFIFRNGLRFAFVGKLGAVFSSRCVKLQELDEEKKPDGQLSLISNAGDERCGAE